MSPPELQLQSADTPSATRAGWEQLTWLHQPAATATEVDRRWREMFSEPPAAPKLVRAFGPTVAVTPEDQDLRLRSALTMLQDRVQLARATLLQLSAQLEALLDEVEEAEARAAARELEPHRRQLQHGLECWLEERRSELEVELQAAWASANRKVDAAHRTAATLSTRSGLPVPFSPRSR